VTNNLCSQRDLYLERTDPQHPRRYLYDGRWEPARERVEEVAIKGQGTVRKTVSASRHGPIVDEVLPPAARQTGPVSLRWMGATPCGWLTALLGMNRSETTDDLRTAMRPWVCPTFSVVFAGVDGRFGYQCSGRIPVRARAERGYRRGWDPADAWQGLIPVDAMPAMRDPARGFIATANNRPALADFPYPLSNTSPSGYRARRIRQLIEEQPVLTRADCQRLQYDVRLLRATEALPALLRALDGGGDERTRQARAWLHAWNGDMHKDSPAAAIFEVFFHRWLDRVIAERFSGERGTLAVGDPAAFVAGGVTGFATALLQSDPAGWFAAEAREPAIRRAFAAALAELTQRLGPDPAAWSWGRLHVLTLRHPLSGRGQLGELLDRGGEPVSGNGFTVGNTGYAPDYAATAGANHRYVTDLADDPPVMWAIDAAGTSGHPGSPHYCDQFADWLRGQYHAIPLDSSNLRTSAAELLVIGPRASA
ncbi:MAG: penicillin acylase family protein, partial [Actinobacteria bacterium]|nr:penicillin acylase family protein [Actinomycetota bacterium]